MTPLGPVQREVLRRAEGSTLGLVFVKDYREMRAARALTARGVLTHWYGTRVFERVKS